MNSLITIFNQDYQVHIIKIKIYLVAKRLLKKWNKISFQNFFLYSFEFTPAIRYELRFLFHSNTKLWNKEFRLRPTSYSEQLYYLLLRISKITAFSYLGNTQIKSVNTTNDRRHLPCSYLIRIQVEYWPACIECSWKKKMCTYVVSPKNAYL